MVRGMRRVSLFALFLAVVGLVAVACVPPDPPPDCSPTGTVAHHDLRYATSPGVAARLQSLDLYLPVRPEGCAPAPLVAYVHGGGFVNGDKTNQIANKVALFTGAGWGFASLNYRLVGDPGSGSTNGEYPAAEQDIAAAITYLSDHATDHGLDADQVMLLGHSAGAFLVALDSTDESFLEGTGSSLADVVCAAPIDTTYDIAAQIAGGGTSELMFRNAFSDDPDTWAAGSPPDHVAPGEGIPQFHIVTRGTASRIAQAQSFGSMLVAAGVPAEVQVAGGLSHAAVNDAIGQPGETFVTDPLMGFFRGCAGEGS